jgi:hypothetical protein
MPVTLSKPSAFADGVEGCDWACQRHGGVTIPQAVTRSALGWTG